VRLLPPPSREEDLTFGRDTLHLEYFLPQGRPHAVVVTVHGYSSHCGVYRQVGAALAAAGFVVTQFDCRGHGRSSGPRGHVYRFAQYLEDLAIVLQRVRKLVPATPLALMGHSHGGTIAADFVLQECCPVPIDRLLLMAPYLDLAMPVPGYKRFLAPLLSTIWPTLAMHNGIRGVDVSRDPQVVESFDRDPLVHHVATARWFQEVRAAHTRILAAAPTLRVPTLLVVAGQDKIVSSATALAFAAAAGPSVDVRRYEALYHEIFLEPERQQVIADLAAWLRSPIGSS